MTTDVAVRKEVFSLTPSSLGEAMKLADLIANSDLAPRDYKGKPGNVLIAVQMGAEVGLSPMAAIQTIAVINGRPSLFGDSGKAILLSHGCIIEEDGADKVRATGMGRCKITRPGHPPVERTFSCEDAKAAGLLGKDGPWKQYTERMLAWRAFWFAARDAAADLLKGLHGAEEVRDIPAMREMGDAVEVKTDRAAATAATLAGGKPREKASPAVEPPTLDEVLAKIAAAETPDEMSKAGELCAMLGAGDKDEGRKAYSARMKVLRAAAGPSYAEIADQINRAQSVAEVNVARDLIRSIKDDGQRAELETLAAKRCDEFAIDGGGNGNA